MNDEEINIVPYSDPLAAYFSTLNTAWIVKYFTLEPADIEMLDNSKKMIIDKGDHIFFALLGNEVAGTFALLNKGDGVYELSKMAVAEKFAGKKIGNRLLQFCIATATAWRAKKIELYSNTILQPAIHLYKKYGFTEVPLDHVLFKRSNIKMERLTALHEQD